MIFKKMFQVPRRMTSKENQHSRTFLKTHFMKSLVKFWIIFNVSEIRNIQCTQ